ncbi:MAG TPA: PSD1 and planctomycete cytochrome C domain-containing protein [Bryobacteraceae bacterium]|nr:PSD1 and planctomycete cytochrome C domain-containing protein [Bryobacteraceae bacterium]
MKRASLLLLSTLTLTAQDYFRDVRPILAERCYPCHGGKVHMSELRLDRRADAMRGGGSGAPAIVPGNSRDSLLVKYISGLDPKTVMPPSGPRLSAEQIDGISTWIDQGAVWPEGAEVATEPPKKSARDHWAFQPRRPIPVPAVKNAGWVRNSIDAFVLAKLEARKWKPSAAATPRQLMRRIYLDVTGLPPTPDEQNAFLKNPDLDRLAADLLSRPTYGERWARHWLDLVRFAETNGYERDATKPSAWRYRDYVIRAFNDDKPFDRFTLEQLAGDELPDASAETLIATGYNRLGPWDDEPADPKTDRFDQLDDIVSTTSQVYLGLTLGCARCHNHKFEPVTANDYYSMVAVFNGLERPRKGRTELALPIGRPEQNAAYREHMAKVDALETRMAAAQKAGSKDEAQELKARLSDLRAATPDVPLGYFFSETKPVPRTFLLIRGSALNPGPEVQPAIPQVLVKSQPVFDKPRLALAKWLVGPDNPLTARIIVNRIWQFHFGEGLVRTPSDFGVMGQKPTHPQLLDFLANWFVDNGWSVKKLHRLILQSNTYRMSKQRHAAYSAEDPDNLLLWRFPYTRLEVEAIRDSMLAVSGRLNSRMYGPSMYPFVPKAALEGSSDPDKIWTNSEEGEASRRTIYAFIKRSMVVPMLEVLDFCDTARSSPKRLNTSVATQALTLFNGEFVNRQAKYFADSLGAGADPAKTIDRAYRRALARPPTSAETKAMVEFLKTSTLEQMCRVIFNLNEFVYPD